MYSTSLCCILWNSSWISHCLPCEYRFAPARVSQGHLCITELKKKMCPTTWIGLRTNVNSVSLKALLTAPLLQCRAMSVTRPFSDTLSILHSQSHSPPTALSLWLHLQEEMSVENPEGRVHSPPNIQRRNHSHTAKPSDANDQQLWKDSECVCALSLSLSRRSLCRSKRKDGYACGPAVPLFLLAAHLVFLCSKHRTFVSLETAEHLYTWGFYHNLVSKFVLDDFYVSFFLFFLNSFNTVHVVLENTTSASTFT